MAAAGRRESAMIQFLLPRNPGQPAHDPMRPDLLKTALVLGLLSAIGPFAIDMYLPALPSIGKSLGTTVGAVQASLMAFFIALGLGPVRYGPVSDMVGRKAPLYFGLVLFALGSIGCALAPDIQTLVALRFVQGLGACATMVIPRAVVRDLHTGHALVRRPEPEGSGVPRLAVVTTRVHFAALSPLEIEAYVASGEPLACAGGFALEGRGGLVVERLEGCFSNVIGLSLPLLRRWLDPGAPGQPSG